MKTISAKDHRIVERELELLFSTRAFVAPTTIEEWKKYKFSLFHPSIRTDHATLPLTESGIAARRRIANIIQKIPEVKEVCSIGEVIAEVHSNYENWIKRQLQPNADEFLTKAVECLLNEVKDYCYLVRIEGLLFENFEQLDLGRIKICKANPNLLKDVDLTGRLAVDNILKHFKGDLWLFGAANGSQEIARQRFEFQVTLTTGILAVCGAILFRGAIWKSHIRVILSPFQQGSVVSTLRWEANGANPTLFHSLDTGAKLPFDTEAISYLRKECFLERLATLPDIKKRSEVEERIVRALYWFADAHSDRNTTMRFVKLWSCIECFFSNIDGGVTEANARGLATVLTFAGYGVGQVEDYPRLKRRIKSLYDLRSRALHRAQFDGVHLNDLEDLSHWVAWLIISMTALSQRGHQILQTINEQVMRLDDLATKTP